MRQRASRAIPDPIKPLLRKIYDLALDLVDPLQKRNGMIPPRSMTFIGGGDFLKIGEEFKQHFIELGHLQPNHHVLDVGCGIGRMAIPLTGYLSKEGEYWGFDIVKKGIEWCQQRISPKYTNFHFAHSNVYNKYYNPKGNIRAQDFKFPFDDQFFDFVFLTSVFTHMLPADVENYIAEISRVLKPGGRCLITFFLLNEETVSLMRSGKSTLDFKFDLSGCLSTEENKPEAAIAYEEEMVKSLLYKNDLLMLEPVYYGSWCGRQNFLTYQDMILATKRM
jgi:ubiquinone/menaquinone biosynthesis C-methylase UbiE